MPTFILKINYLSEHAVFARLDFCTGVRAASQYVGDLLSWLYRAGDITGSSARVGGGYARGTCHVCGSSRLLLPQRMEGIVASTRFYTG